MKIEAGKSYMIPKTPLLNLAGRCERARYPSAALDRAIEAATGVVGVPSGSLDDAAQLIPDGYSWQMVPEGRTTPLSVTVYVTPPGGRMAYRARGRRYSLALCAAALLALADMEGAR